MRKKSNLIAFALLATSTQLQASGIIIYEVGSPISGTAAVGQAVTHTDASASFFNPAAMSFLPHNDILVGGQLTKTSLEFTPDSMTTISGTGGRNAGILIPGMGIFGVYHDRNRPKLSYGINVTAPVAAVASYSDGWVGRYFVNKTSLMVLAINPSVSYKINDNFSVGGGVALNYGLFNQTMAVNRVAAADGEIELENLDDYTFQFNLGALYKLTNTTQIGISYRSPIKLKLHGTTRFTLVDPTTGVGMGFTIPQTVTMSVSQLIREKFNVVADLGWQNWSVFDASVISITGLPSVSVPRKWKDTWRVGAGVNYLMNKLTTLKAGISYDSSTTELTTRRPELPIDRQWRFAIGFDYLINDAVKFSSSFQYADLGTAPIYQVNNFNGNLSGKYTKNTIYVLQASLSMV